MKQYLLFPLLVILSFLSLGSNTGQADTRKGQDYAIFFAVDNYASNPGFDDLNNPIGDARAIAKELEEMYAFDATVYENPSKNRISGALKQWHNRHFDTEDQLFAFLKGLKIAYNGGDGLFPYQDILASMERVSPKPYHDALNGHDEGGFVFEVDGIVDSEVSRSTIYDDLILIQGGTFQMGSNKINEKPIHTVTVPSFKISKYEVTQKQWREVTGHNPSNFKGCDNCPVENVSWSDVQFFLTRLNQQTGKMYRLPTEAEWEYAAKGGRQSRGYKYAGSNRLGEVAWYNENSLDRGSEHENYGTNPVGQKKANELGIYDMIGNVWEWCEDTWHSSYKGSPRDGTAWVDSSPGSIHVFRGGSWAHSVEQNSVTNRPAFGAGFKGKFLGFRLAHTL